MSDQLPMFDQPISEDSLSAISSLESESGVMRSGSQDGQTINKSGRARAPARPSAQQAKAKGLMTLATSGRLGIDSSASQSLQSSLENRLMTLLDSAGSTLFKLTWKRKRTPLGRRYLERAVSVRRTSGSGFTSVPMPAKADGERGSNTMMRGGGQAKRAMGETRHGSNLNDFAMLAGVPTPCAPNGDRSMSTEKMDATGKTADGRKHTASLEPLPTPTTRDWKSGSEAQNFKSRDCQLNDEVKLASVATPAANEYEQRNQEALMERRERCKQNSGNGNGFGFTLGNQARLADSGPTVTGGTEKTASGGQLNPAYSRWLMGLPREWDDCAVTAMALLPKRRKRS